MRGFFLALLLLVAAPVLAAEEIVEFDAVFEVQEDASVTITERITVNAERDEIRRGIFRDVPTRLTGPGGHTIRMPFEVISVTRNGEPEAYEMEDISGGQRIRIGQSLFLLPQGLHEYEIVYRMDRAARMFDTYDEFYWNATGNYWAFPIREASALVVLPEGAQISALDVYTGAEGETGADAAFDELSPNRARFTTTRVLAPREGMTISVAFEKGALSGPSGGEAIGFWLSDRRDFIVPLVMLLAVLAYNGLAWSAVGRDPAKGVIFPRFYAPKNFSPALTHYVHTMGWGKSGWTAFSAALVSLAIKGLIEIDAEGRKNTLTVTGSAPKDPLPPGEAVIFEHLQPLSPVTIDKSSGPKLDKARRKFVSAIESENRQVYFKNNAAYTVIGAMIGLAALGAMVLLDVLDPAFVFMAGVAAILLSVAGTVIRGFWQGRGINRFFIIAIGTILFANTGAFALDALDISRIDFPFVAAVTIIAVTLVFGILMRAPTVHGRKVMDEIDGFKMYLETAEKERLNFDHEPQMSVARFEAILPYAMALGVERPWSERFENDLARHAVKDAGPSYSPHWHRGTNFSAGSFARTMGGVASGLSAAMISSQPKASTSTGSGGGGFSGGGGGGGGGGGW